MRCILSEQNPISRGTRVRPFWLVLRSGRGNTDKYILLVCSNHISPHHTLPIEESQDGTDFGADLSTSLAFSSAAQPENGTLDPSTTHLTELCPDNGNSFLVAQRTTHLGMDYAPPVEPHMRKHIVESVEKFNDEQFCTNCRGNAVQDATTSDSTPPEGSDPFLCKWPSCNWNRPFKTKGIFNRHQLLHGSRKFKCPMDFCPWSRKGFHRKDKLMSHLERGHHKNKQQAKMLACEQELAILAMMEEMGWDLEADLFALD